MKRALIVASLALLFTGCASTPATPAPKPTTYYGQTASAIAALIKGCSDVKPGDIGDGAVSGLASTATCMLKGRQVDVNGWATSDAQEGVANLLKANAVEAYFAEGTGWTVTVSENPELQMQFENDAGGLLKYSMDNPTLPAPDVPGQKATASAAVRSLGGKVTHVTP